MTGVATLRQRSEDVVVSSDPAVRYPVRMAKPGVGGAGGSSSSGPRGSKRGGSNLAHGARSPVPPARSLSPHGRSGAPSRRAPGGRAKGVGVHPVQRSLAPGERARSAGGLFTQSEGFGNPLVRYWPTLVGVCVAGAAVYSLLPEGAPTPPPLVTYEDVESPEESTHVDSPPAAVGRPEYLGTASPVALPAPQPELQYQTVERPVLTAAQVETSAARTLTQDDPQVKRALAQVPIVLYAPPGDSSVQEVKRYLSASGLSFREHQMGDPLTSTKARHLRVAGEGLLVVIDGQELPGFSPAAVQEALTAAVKKRLGDLAGPSVAAP